MPPELEVVRETAVTPGRRDRPEPDVLFARAEADTGPGRTGCRPEGVVLAVEVVPADSGARDRETEPRRYAADGIPHLWRMEEDGGRPVVRVLDPEPAARTCAVTGIHHDRFEVSVPFPADVGLGAVGRR